MIHNITECLLFYLHSGIWREAGAPEHLFLRGSFYDFSCWGQFPKNYAYYLFINTLDKWILKVLFLPDPFLHSMRCIAFKEVRGDGSVPVTTVTHLHAIRIFFLSFFLRFHFSFLQHHRWTIDSWSQNHQTEAPCVISTTDCTLQLLQQFPKIKLNSEPWIKFLLNPVSVLCHLYYQSSFQHDYNLLFTCFVFFFVI